MATDGPPHQVRRGQRIILRGPNGAGKSTLLKALSGTLPLAAGTRLEDERLRLGVFAQDLAQELPQAVASNFLIVIYRFCTRCHILGPKRRRLHFKSNI